MQRTGLFGHRRRHVSHLVLYASQIPEGQEAIERMAEFVLSRKTRNSMDKKDQNFEVRAFISDIAEAQKKLSLLNALFKGEYEFKDYIYFPQDREFDLNKEFMRLRVYQKTQWDQKAVELSYKVKSDPGVSGNLKLKKQFDLMEEADPSSLHIDSLFRIREKGSSIN